MTIELPDGKLVFRASIDKRTNEFTDFHYNEDLISRCFGLKTYSLVEVTLDEDGDYFGWFDFKNNTISPSFIWRHLIALRTCFNSEIATYEEAGVGKVVKLKVTLLEENLSVK